MKKKRFKTRLLAFLTVVLVLVPVLGLSVFAYPAEEYIPANEFINFGGSGIPVYETDILATCNYTGLEVGDSYEVTFADIGFSFNDNTQAWQYISFQLDVILNGVNMGHYTAGFYREYSGAINYRLGRTELQNITGSSYPVMASLPSDTASVMVGLSIEKETNGRPNICIELVALDANNLVVDSASFVEICPVTPDAFTYRGKTEFARVNTAAVINNTTVYPHMPTDLVSLSLLTDDAYNNGYEDGKEHGQDIGYDAGYNSAASDSANTFDNMGKLIWTIVDMPFVLVTQIMNFELFGVNMADIILGLLTIGLVVFILGKVGVFA